ncbi:MAG: cyclic nucleotide-binding domain-containing protein [Pseudomonadota bacterium]
MSLSWLNIRTGEGHLVLILGSFFFLMLAGLTAIGIAADTLFVAQIGPEKLPLGILLGQALVIPVFKLYGLARANLKARWLAPWSIGLIVAALIGLFAAQQGPALIAAGGLLILLPSIAGVLSSENSRLSAGLLDSRSARRLSPTIGTIGGFGATFGAYLSAEASARIGVAPLVPLGAVLLAASLLPAWLCARRIRRRREPRPPEAKPIHRNRYALVLILAAGIVAAIATILRYQIGAAAAEQYNEAELGLFYSRLAIAINILAIVFTLVITRLAVSRLGAANSLLLYPGFLILAAAIALVSPGLAAVTFAVASERLIRQNIHRTVSTLAIMPLHEQLRARIGLLINGSSRPLGTILSSAAVLLLTGQVPLVPIGLAWQDMSYIVAGLAVLLLFGFWFVRSRYVVELIAALHARRLHLDRTEDAGVAMDPALKTLLLGYLRSDLPERTALALELLGGYVDDDVVDEIAQNWPGWEPWLRAQAVRTLGDDRDAPPVTDFIARLGPDEPDEVRAAALSLSGENTDTDTLSATAADAPVNTRAQAIAMLIDRQGVASTKGLVETLAASDNEDDRLTAALTIVRVEIPWLDYLIPQLLDVAPTELLETVMKRPHDRFAEACTHWLASDQHERFARAALAAIGDAAIPALRSAAQEPRLSAQALGVLGDLGTNAAEAALRECLAAPDPALKFRALAVAATRPGRWRGRADDVIGSEISDALERAEQFSALAKKGSGIAERVAANEADYELERLFLALALRDPTVPFRQIYLAAGSPDKRQRALAAETLDEYLRGAERARILALTEPRDNPTTATTGTNGLTALRDVLDIDEAIDEQAVAALLECGLFPGWRLGDLTDLLATGDDNQEHLLLIRGGIALDVESLILTGANPTRQPGDIGVPLNQIYAVIARNARCGGLWLRGLAQRIPDLSDAKAEITRSEMLSLATRTLADDRESADDIDIWQRVFFLRTMGLTQSLPSDRLRLLAEISRTVSAEAGDVIVREGRLGNHFYMICRGSLRVSSSDGSETRLGPSDAFGALALMRGARRSQTVVAEEPSELLTIDRVDFLDLIDAHPSLVRSFSRLLAARAAQSAAPQPGAPSPSNQRNSASASD